MKYILITQMILCSLQILISQSYIISISGARNESCPEDEYLSKNGFCCNKCHAGKAKVIQHFRL